MPNFLVRRTEPYELATRFLAACSSAFKAEPVSEFSIATNVREPHFAMNGGGVTFQSLGTQAPLTAFLDYLKSRPFVEIKSMSARGANTRTPQLRFAAQQHRATLTIDASEEGRMDGLVDAVAKHFDLIRESQAIEDLWPEELRRELLHQESATDTLRESVSRLGQHLVDQGKWFSEVVKQKLAEIDKQLEQRRTELQSEFEARHRQLDAREKELNERKIELDRAEYKAGRREAYRRLVAQLTGAPLETLGPKQVAPTPEASKATPVPGAPEARAAGPAGSASPGSPPAASEPKRSPPMAGVGRPLAVLVCTVLLVGAVVVSMYAGPWGIVLALAAAAVQTAVVVQAQRARPEAVSTTVAPWAVSEPTLAKRYVIHAVCVAVLLSALAGAALAGHTVLNVPKDDFHWRLLIPFSTSVLAFGSTLVFYLSWTNRWFSDHAEQEFMNRKLGADVMRAHWLAELLFEWQEEEEQKEFPAQLLERLSGNLFSANVKGDVEHPLAAGAKALQELPRALGRLEERLGKLPGT
jgi:hypothetical protein